MNPLRKVGGLLLIAGSALAGNWIGAKLRATTTGEAEHSLGLLHTTHDQQQQRDHYRRSHCATHDGSSLFNE